MINIPLTVDCFKGNRGTETHSMMLYLAQIVDISLFVPKSMDVISPLKRAMREFGERILGMNHNARTIITYRDEDGKMRKYYVAQSINDLLADHPGLMRFRKKIYALSRTGEPRFNLSLNYDRFLEPVRRLLPAIYSYAPRRRDLA